ncbi:helix-turn-helix protein [Lutibacter oceani]|uniref:Helix-turn-helix protein n=1 Tax=Lutibacter oceani TaxID=1853311 RepID=A0A3D9RXD7_9FLAO|nr:helix-turn-helix transcriptional regulator [Lutibacter oceani]REE81766.1 helix-turn-helix protein [Lutibacter oceani]
MVNVEEFAKRLKIIIDYYEISAALLAEKIEVQRSSISHILSGRNKPSLDFVLKILKVFPEVELYWLLNGVGKFPKEIENKASTPSLFPTNESGTIIKEKMIQEPNSSVEIDRIVIFFKDGTFKNYKN